MESERHKTVILTFNGHYHLIDRHVAKAGKKIHPSLAALFLIENALQKNLDVVNIVRKPADEVEPGIRNEPLRFRIDIQQLRLYGLIEFFLALLFQDPFTVWCFGEDPYSGRKIITVHKALKNSRLKEPVFHTP